MINQNPKHMKDYYHILEVPFGSDSIDIKKAYRRLALKFHPDKNNTPNAVIKFIEITEAYEVLGNKKNKLYYDEIYQEFFIINKNNHIKTTSFKTFEQKQKKWSEYGKQKAKEYSSIPFNKFIKQINKDLKVGINYIPNIIALFIVVIFFIKLLTVIPESINKNLGITFILLIILLGLFYLFRQLLIVAIADFKEEIKHK